MISPCHSEKFLLLTMNVPRPRALLAEQYHVLTWFSGRTPDISGVGFCILARPAMTDSSVERASCASSLANMFFAALTLLLRLLPQSGHLNRILFLSCADGYQICSRLKCVNPLRFCSTFIRTGFTLGSDAGRQSLIRPVA